MLSWIDRANSAPTLIERIRALLRADNHISFVELEQLDGFRGDQTITLDDRPDLVLWTGVSRQAAADLAMLITAGECRIGRASLFTYLADGKVLDLPVAKRDAPYEKPHWLPAALVRA